MDPALSTNARPEIIPLWPDGAPGSEGWDQEEQESVFPPSLKVIRNVSQPTLTAYLAPPSAAAGTAVIVCPGGAFHFLSIEMEGTGVARWLNARGVAAFVLKYRLIRTGEDFPAQVRGTLAEHNRMAGLMTRLTPRCSRMASRRCGWCAGAPPHGAWRRSGSA